MILSGKRALSAVVIGLLSNAAWAGNDAPPFDRPGTAFNTGVFEPGAGAWEQGLPSVAFTRGEGMRLGTWVADTRLRAGLGAGLELQWAQDSFGGQRSCGDGGGCRYAQGGGDGALALKWAVPHAGDARTTLAVLATHTLVQGRAPIGGGGRADQLAVSATHGLGNDRSLGFSLARDWTAEGNGWLASLNVGWQPAPRWSAYVETVAGQGSDHARALGAGTALQASARTQLDAWLLRGLDARTPDWQGGVGVSIAFGRR